MWSLSWLHWEQFAALLIDVVFLSGIYFCFEENIKLLYFRNKRRWLLSDRTKKNRSRIPIVNHLNWVVETAAGEKFSTQAFLYVTSIIFITSVLVFYSVIGIASIFLSAACAAIPYILLRMRLERQRYKGSNEAELLVSRILNNYRVNHFNIYETMETVVREDDPEMKITQKQLFRLLMELRNTKNPEEMKRSTDKFAYGIKTNWCNMLSQCIYAAVSEGINISASLEDIMDQLKAARTLAEEKKRLNSESTRMIQLLIPIAYGGSVFVGVKYLGIPFKTMLQNQLFTKAGLLLITVILLLSIVNLALVDLVKKGKFDF